MNSFQQIKRFFSSPKPDLQGGNILKATITLNLTWAGFKVLSPSWRINKHFPQLKSLFYRKWNPFTFLLRSSDGRTIYYLWYSKQYFSMYTAARQIYPAWCFIFLRLKTGVFGKRRHRNEQSLISHQSRKSLQSQRAKTGPGHLCQIGWQLKILTRKKIEISHFQHNREVYEGWNIE